MVARIRGALARPAPTTWLAWLLPVFAWAPLTYPGYFEFRSGFTAVFNLNDLARRWPGLAWAPAFGQPYELLRAEGSLPYRLALLPLALGLTAPAAVKLVMAVSLLAGALGCYAWSRRALGDWPALLAAVLYVLWPPNLAAVYVRGAFAEAVFLGLAPWLLWAASRAGGPRAGRARGRGLAFVTLALGLALLLSVQAGLGLWFALVLLAYLLALRPGLPALLAWGGGLTLGVLGLAPLFAARGMGGGAAPIAAQLLYPHQLFAAAAFNPGPSVPDNGGFTGLGIVALGLALFALLRSPAPDTGPTRRCARLAAVLVCVAVLLSTTLAGGFWRLVPGLGRTLAAPAQLLVLAGPWLAWLAAAGGAALWQRAGARDRLPVAAGILALVVLGSYPYLAPPSTAQPVPALPAAVFGEEEIALLDATVSGLPQAGETVTATVRWQALRPIDRDYTVFFQAIGPDGQLWGQQDVMPQGGQAPTSSWQPGQVIADAYRLALKPGAPGGTYRFTLGLYAWQTGERLRAGADDKVVVKPAGDGQ